MAFLISLLNMLIVLLINQKDYELYIENKRYYPRLAHTKDEFLPQGVTMIAL